MRMAWISGWAVPTDWFHALVSSAWPGATHTVVAANAGALDELERLAGGEPFDLLGGYSLGSHLLLDDRERAGKLAREVVLLAPIFAFVREEGLGGVGARTHVRYLRRWLRIDPLAALRDFYLRAGLDVTPPAEPDLQMLDWGLELLERGRIEPPAPAGWRLFCGEVDDLVSAERLQSVCPGVVRVPGSGHHPGGLARAAAAFMRWSLPGAQSPQA